MSFNPSVGRAGQGVHRSFGTKLLNKFGRLSGFKRIYKSSAVNEAERIGTNDGSTSNTRIDHQAKELLSSSLQDGEQGSNSNDEPTTLHDNTTQILSLANGHRSLVKTVQRSSAEDQESTKANSDINIKSHSAELLLPIDNMSVNDRPRTRDSEIERYREGSGHDFPDLNFTILVDVIDKDGNIIMKVLALVDTGADTSCVTQTEYQQVRGPLNVKALHLPTQFKHTYTNPISKDTWEPTEYIALRVRGGTIGIPDTIVNFALFDDIGSDSEDTSSNRNSLTDVVAIKPKFFLGRDFIKRHQLGFLAQIADANLKEFHAALEGSSTTSFSMFAPIQEDRKSREQKAADNAKNEEIKQKGRAKAKELLALLDNTKPGQANGPSSSPSTICVPIGSYTENEPSFAGTTQIDAQDLAEMTLPYHGRYPSRTNTSASGETIFSKISDVVTAMTSTSSLGYWSSPAGMSVSDGSSKGLKGSKDSILSRLTRSRHEKLKK